MEHPLTAHRRYLAAKNELGLICRDTRAGKRMAQAAAVLQRKLGIDEELRQEHPDMLTDGCLQIHGSRRSRFN